MCALHTQHNRTNFRFAHKISSKRKQKLHEHGVDRSAPESDSESDPDPDGDGDPPPHLEDV